MSDHEIDSDVPEEVTAEEGIKQDEELRKIKKANAIRLLREGKKRRKLRAQTKAPQKLGGDDDQRNILPTDQPQEGPIIRGMLPSNIVDLLAAREKITFSSDSEEEIVDHKPTATKRKKQELWPGIVFLKEAPAARCLHNSMEFLKRRKSQVPRSSSVLKNSHQALRLLSSRGSPLSNS